MDAGRNDVRDETGIWPVRVVADGIERLSLWFLGDTDLMLTREGRIATFPSRETLADEVIASRRAFAPSRLAHLDTDVLRLVVAAPATEFDLDRARAWLGSPDRERSIEACEQLLNALNMACDVGASVDDTHIADAFTDDTLAPLHDALTFGLTLLGDGSPLRNNPDAMVAAITPASATAALDRLDLAARHLVAEW